MAASAAVPVIFPPLELRGLYPDRTVRLVDGGVHDNQGTGALLDQDCTLLVVSDASGQSGAVSTPSDTPFRMLTGPAALANVRRTSSIRMEGARVILRWLGWSGDS